MNILFHVEPLIEMQRPFLKTGWATDFCRRIADSLLAFRDRDFRFRIVLSEPVALRFEHDEIEKIVLRQREIFEAFGSSDYLEISIAWQNRTYREEQVTRTSALYSRKLGGFEPDLIVCFSAVPYLERLFPSALIFHKEYSIFSRKPYPQTWFFDPCGMYDRTFLNVFSRDIRKTSIPDKGRRLLRDFKHGCRELIRSASPFRPLLSEMREKHRALALLPLQFSGYVGFDSFIGHRSQYDFLLDVLERAPDDVGVVVTTHPDYNHMTDEVIEYLRYQHANFIYDRSFETYCAPSQYLLADVDSVITVSSSIGLQTLLWDIPLINPGGVWRCIASGTEIRDVPNGGGGCSAEERDAVLYWLLTGYAMSPNRISDGEWLCRFFERSVGRKRSCGITAGFFEEFPDVEATFRELADNLDANVPEVSTGYSYDRAIEIMNRKTAEAKECGEKLERLRTELSQKNSLLDKLGPATLRTMELLKAIEEDAPASQVSLAAARVCESLRMHENAKAFLDKAMSRRASRRTLPMST